MAGQQADRVRIDALRRILVDADARRRMLVRLTRDLLAYRLFATSGGDDAARFSECEPAHDQRGTCTEGLTISPVRRRPGVL
jgi:hypothetical protein